MILIKSESKVLFILNVRIQKINWFNFSKLFYQLRQFLIVLLHFINSLI